MAILQFDRDYALYLGWYDTPTAPEAWGLLEKPPQQKGILVKDLQIEFDVNKVLSNQQSPSVSKIRIFNLTVEQTSALSDFHCSVRLLVGYKGANNMAELCLGNALLVKTVMQGADRVTELTLSDSHAIMNSASIVSTIPAGKTIEDVIVHLMEKSGLKKGVFEGKALKTKVLYGYPIEGTPKQILDEIAASYRLDYTVERGTLSIRDKGQHLFYDKTKAFVFNEDTGLREIPSAEEWGEGSRKIAGEKKKRKVKVEGISIKALLNPAVVPGSVIELRRPEAQVDEVPNGFYVVREASYKGSFFGSTWDMDLRCDSIGAYQ